MNLSGNQRRVYLLALGLLILAIALVCAWSLWLRPVDAALAGGRINRIVQPERDELILTIRSGGENRQLLLSATARIRSPSASR